MSRPKLLREITIVGIIFFIWQYFVWLTTQVHENYNSNGLAIVRIEDVLHIDCEKWIQFHTIDLWRSFNWYYGTMHVVVMAAVLIWAYVSLPAYKQIRNTVIVGTLVSLAISVWQVAPLRLLNIGIIDTAGQTIYNSKVVDQYSAFPSTHVVWATITSIALWKYGHKWMALHLPITVLVVIATGNHSVLDCLTGLTIGALSWAVCFGLPLDSWAELLSPRTQRTSATHSSEQSSSHSCYAPSQCISQEDEQSPSPSPLP